MSGAATIPVPAGLRAGPSPSRDRLFTTLFVATLLHGLLIVGITFDAGRDAGIAPGLEVLLVSDEVPESAANDTATYLAQRTQKGSGNTDRAVAPGNRAGGPPLDASDGTPDGAPSPAPDPRQPGADAADEPVLTSPAPGLELRWIGMVGADAPAAPLLVPAALPGAGPGDETDATQVRGARRDELYVTPDTRADGLAPYVDAWKRKVERIGTLNFPAVARRRTARASPVVDVAIDASGRLVSASVARSSGHPDLDQSALAILKLASPFDPFPPELADRYGTLRFAYEWQFVGGRLEAGSVSTVP